MSLFFLLSLVGCNSDVAVIRAKVDDDGDGYSAEVDCDDAHATVNPDATEICDGLDNDCDGDVDDDPEDKQIFYADVDQDGYGDPTNSETGCAASDGFISDASDCDDTQATVFPGNTEVCDGLDNDCNNQVDDNPTDQQTVYVDADEDGYGDDATATEACELSAGESLIGGDCDDQNSRIHPDASETDCSDATDYNCDGSVAYEDADADGYAACEDCADLDASVHPDAPEICNQIDDDCDGLIDDADDTLTGATTWYRDPDGDGYTSGTGPSLTQCLPPSGYAATTGDCDDTDASVNPGAAENCDERNVDEDCDGVADDQDATTTFASYLVYYRDLDGDTYGDSGRSVSQCDAPASYVTLDGDCDDSDSTIHPGASEICDQTDNDCDTLIDDADPGVTGLSTWYLDVDGDGYGLTVSLSCSQPANGVLGGGDCNDNNAAISPGLSERCDAANTDENCNGLADDADSGASGKSTWYADGDGDGYGSTSSLSVCDVPAGYVSSATDCVDTDAAINPAATEICDPMDVDENCNGLADDADSGAVGISSWYVDQDGDGDGSGTLKSGCDRPSQSASIAKDCDDTDPAINSLATEICDPMDVDENCNGLADNADSSTVGTSSWYPDLDGDGEGASSLVSGCDRPSQSASNGIDCNDTDATINTQATERCDAANTDENCNGLADNADSGATGQTSWYLDADADSYGGSTSKSFCDVTSGYVATSNDCDDATSSTNPGATELCKDLVDNDCDGATDEGCASRILTGDHSTADYDTKIYGNEPADNFGYSLASGDYDGDGLVDVVVSAPDDEYSSGTNGYGTAYLYRGALASGVSVDSANDAAYLYSTNPNYSSFGYAVWTLPDMDADGKDELAVAGSWTTGYMKVLLFRGSVLTGSVPNSSQYGSTYNCDDISGAGNFYTGSSAYFACGYDPSGTSGTVYVYPDSSSGAVVTLTGEASLDYAGKSIDFLHDFDGDGVTDALVGAFGNDTGVTGGGAGYILYGPLSGSVKLANADMKYTGIAAYDQLATQVAAGDLDGDGDDDVLLGTPSYNYAGRNNCGAVFGFTSKPGGTKTASSASISIYGASADDLLGLRSVSTGDVDGDGKTDLLVGADYNSGVALYSGGAWLLYGDLSGSYDLSTDYDARWRGEAASVYVGADSLIAGDTDGDGVDDLLISGPNAYEGSGGRGGAVWLMLGG